MIPVFDESLEKRSSVTRSRDKMEVAHLLRRGVTSNRALGGDGMGGGLLGIVSAYPNHTPILYTRMRFVFETDRLSGNQLGGLTDFQGADQRRGTAGNSRLSCVRTGSCPYVKERSQARPS